MREEEEQKQEELVVLVVPTCRRAPFFPMLIHCFDHQDYQPRSALRMIIYDDTPEGSNEQALNEVLANYPEELRRRVTYHYYVPPTTSPTITMPIGKKRNLLNELAKEAGATYIACVDDDDYYFPTRVSFSVNQLRRRRRETSSLPLIAGCSSVAVYFPLAWGGGQVDVKKDLTFRVYASEQLYRSPTMGSATKLPGNLCNGSLCYHVSYLETHRYNDQARQAEEAQFLNFFHEHVIHLPSERVFICIAHGSNTVEKYTMLPNFSPMLIEAKTMMDGDEVALRFYRKGATEPVVLSTEIYKLAAASASASSSAATDAGGGGGGGSSSTFPALKLVPQKRSSSSSLLTLYPVDR